MDFNNLKNLIPNNGERYIIVEQGRPTVVLMSFDDYQKLIRAYGNPVPVNPVRDLSLNGVNVIPRKETVAVPEMSLPETEALKSPRGPEQKSEKEAVEDLKLELNRELTLDDLPF